MSADINVGAITEALNGKMDLPTNVPQDAVDYVVAMQRPTADNNYTWYRKYKSGWVEQGGIYTGQANRPTIALPVTMSNEHYTVDALIRWDNSGNVANTVRVISATNTSIVFNQANGTAGATFDFYWQVSGMAA